MQDDCMKFERTLPVENIYGPNSSPVEKVCNNFVQNVLVKNTEYRHIESLNKFLA